MVLAALSSPSSSAHNPHTHTHTREAVSPAIAACGGPCLILCFSPQVILKDLEVLAEIASSPAGQTEDPGPLDGPDLRVSHSELQVPTPGRASLLTTPSKYPLMPPASGTLGTPVLGLVLDWGRPRCCPSPALEFCQAVRDQ